MCTVLLPKEITSKLRTEQAIAGALGCPQKLNSKTLLLDS